MTEKNPPMDAVAIRRRRNTLQAMLDKTLLVEMDQHDALSFAISLCDLAAIAAHRLTEEAK